MKRPPFYIIHPGEGESLNLGEAVVAFKATGEDTANAFTVCECQLLAGVTPITLHDTANGLDAAYTGIYVLAGEVCLLLGSPGSDRVRVRAGGFALLRPDATCSLTHSGLAAQPARFLCFTSSTYLEQHLTRLANQMLRPPNA